MGKQKQCPDKLEKTEGAFLTVVKKVSTLEGDINEARDILIEKRGFVGAEDYSVKQIVEFLIMEHDNDMVAARDAVAKYFGLNNQEKDNLSNSANRLISIVLEKVTEIKRDALNERTWDNFTRGLIAGQLSAISEAVSDIHRTSSPAILRTISLAIDGTRCRLVSEREQKNDNEKKDN